MKPSGQQQVDAAKADGRWDAAYAPMRDTTIPDDLRAAIDASPCARKTFGTLGRQNLFALAYRTNGMKTAARPRKEDCRARGDAGTRRDDLPRTALKHVG
jgi:uncharacterized protein YdeI (YjbR/CyaY-like superfamily)